MRTLYPMMFMLAVAITASMFQFSGFNAGVGQSTDVGVGLVQEKVTKAQQNSTLKKGFDADGPLARLSAAIVITLQVAQQAMDLATTVLLLPIALQDLGFPRWFAYPLGGAAQLIAGIGILQIIGGQWR